MTCPLPQQLQQLIDETLPGDQQTALQSHLETCAACQKKVEQLAAGGVTWDKAADILNDKPNPTETALIDAVEKLQDTPTSAINTQAENVARPIDEDLSFLQPSQKANSIGRLDKYEILSVVGKGGFGIVLKAFDEDLHRVVAIKVLLPHLAANGAARERFRREAKAAAAIMHENVVAIHAVSPGEAKVPYLVMQFISGQTLGEKIDKTGPLSVKEVLRIGMQIAEGLAAANKNEGLVHRDIKPANILLENGVERVKISDFGLARSADDASVTQSGTVAGTPMYMSPEQANGEALDHRSDLFSLGSVLYVMSTGRPPFRANTTMAVMKRVCEDTPTPVQEVNAEIPSWLGDIIAKLHAKRPADRFQTAKELAELLGQHLADVQAGRAEVRKRPVEAPATEQRKSYTPLPARVWHGAGVAAFGVELVVFGLAVRQEVWDLRTTLLMGHALFACVTLALCALWFALRPAANRLAQATIVCSVLSVACAVALVGVSLTGRGLREDPATAQLLVEVDESGPVRLEIFATGKPETKQFFPYVGGHRLRFDQQLPLGEWNVVAYYSRPTDPPFRANFELGPSPRKIVVPALDQQLTAESGWVQLFNGKDLAGWASYGGNASAGRGELALSAGCFVDTIDKMPKNFHLRMQVKLLRGHGTVRFHARAEAERNNQPSLDGWFVNFAEDITAKGMVEGQLVSVEPGKKSGQSSSIARDFAKLDEWFFVEIIAKDRTAKVLVNGKETVLRLTHEDFPPTAGVISLWNNGRDDAEIAFRNIEIKDLASPTGDGNVIAGWGKVVDPKGDCKLASEPDGLTITVPPGFHDLNPKSNVDAPRVLQPAKGDFDIQVTVPPFAQPRPDTNAAGTPSVYVSGGLVCWQNRDNFVRFFRAANGRPGSFPTYAALEIHHQGKNLTLPARQIPDVALLLRIERRDGYFRCTYSTDGTKWIEIPLPRQKFLADELEAGVAALNTTIATHVAQFRKIEFKALPPAEPGWVQVGSPGTELEFAL